MLSRTDLRQRLEVDLGLCFSDSFEASGGREGKVLHR